MTWTHYISHVGEDEIVITDEEYYTTYDKEPFIEKYGEEVIIEGRMFVILEDGNIAWCMTRITKADRLRAKWYGTIIASRYGDLFETPTYEEST